MNTKHAQAKWINTLLAAMALSLSSQAFARGEQNVVTNNDSDGDRIVDTIDVDDDNDGITDVNEIAGNGQDVDTDKDGIVDRLDLDSDNDGILDWQESGAVLTIDFSSLRIVGGRVLGEVGENGYLDALESELDTGRMRYALVNSDYPADELPDAIDLDSDNDGLPDMLEAGLDMSMDTDKDARIDISQGSVGNDGIPNRIQKVADESCCDVNGDGVEDVVPRNSDWSDLPDYQDLDSDNDGISDLIEAGGSDNDRDGRVDNFSDSPVLDGMDDTLLSIPLSAPDLNGNAVADHIDPFSAVVETPVQEEQAPASEEQAPQDNVVMEDEQSRDPTVSEQPVSGTTATPNSDAGGTKSDQVMRPGSDMVPTENVQPSEDDPMGQVETGLNAAGCSVQSSGIDWLLLMLVVFSIASIGWRYTSKTKRK